MPCLNAMLIIEFGLVFLSNGELSTLMPHIALIIPLSMLYLALVYTMVMLNTA